MLLFDIQLYNDRTRKYMALDDVLPAVPATVPPELFDMLFDLTHPDSKQNERPQEAEIISALIDAAKLKHPDPLKVVLPLSVRRVTF